MVRDNLFRKIIIIMCAFSIVFGCENYIFASNIRTGEEFVPVVDVKIRGNTVPLTDVFGRDPNALKITDEIAGSQEEKERKEAIKDAYLDSYYISLAAETCLSAYDPKTSVLIEHLSDHGWKSMPVKKNLDGVEINFMIYKKHLKQLDKNIYLVAFRGSASEGDWKLNFKTSQEPFGGNSFEESLKIADEKGLPSSFPKVHKGFNRYSEAVLKTMLDTDNDGIVDKPLFQIVLEDKNTFAILSGHSLGGAVATLVGSKLASYGIAKNRFIVVTFGAPAIANAAFVKEYEDSIDLIRITTKADPIPGSLQTFFGGYKQFGENIKYDVSPIWSNHQHDMTLYYDQSITEFFKQRDIAVKAGIEQLTPDKIIIKPKLPTFAIWVGTSGAVEKHKYVPDVKRFMMLEYERIIPNFVIMDENYNMNQEKMDMLKMYSKAEEAGADYILVLEIDGRSVQDSRRWYMNLNQVVFDVKKREMLAMDSFSHNVSATSGNIVAAINNINSGKERLVEKFPWIERKDN